MNKSRVEAITDGIVAIAATIMVLELGIPSANDWSGLLEIRHTFLAYVISFKMIYIVWAMHHDLFKKATVILLFFQFFFRSVPVSPANKIA